MHTFIFKTFICICTAIIDKNNNIINKKKQEQHCITVYKKNNIYKYYLPTAPLKHCCGVFCDSG